MKVLCLGLLFTSCASRAVQGPAPESMSVPAVQPEARIVAQAVAPTVTPTVTKEVAAQDSSASPLSVQLVLPEGGPPLNEYFSLEVHLSGTTAAQLGVEDLWVAADMPEHGHGILTEPVIERLAPGRFRVHGMLLHMPGDWVLWAEAGAPQGERARSVERLSLDFGGAR